MRVSTIGLFCCFLGIASVARSAVAVRIEPDIQHLREGESTTFTAEVVDLDTGNAAPAPAATVWTFHGEDGETCLSTTGPSASVRWIELPSWALLFGGTITVSARIPDSGIHGQASLVIQPGSPRIRKRLPGWELVAPVSASPGFRPSLSPKRAETGARNKRTRYPPGTLSLESPAIPESDDGGDEASAQASSSSSLSPLEPESPKRGGLPPEASSSAWSTPPRHAAPSSFSTPPSRLPLLKTPPPPAGLPTPGALRRFPPKTVLDGPKRSASPAGEIAFGDEEILWDIVQASPIVDVLQQRTSKSCGQTVLVMRMEDLGLAKRNDCLAYLNSSKLTHARELLVDLAGFSKEAAARSIRLDPAGPGGNTVGRKNRILATLREAIDQHGPVIASITDPKIGGHWIIVDQIVCGAEVEGKAPNPPHARIRDPYHGWAIPVTLDALLDRMVFEDDPQTLLSIYRSEAPAPLPF